jgi:RNA polymerase sigma-70 factor, ECF subfamily
VIQADPILLWERRRQAAILSDPSQASSQAALLRACATGDRGALARLYDATSAQLFGLALRIVRRRELAEEVVQDAFLSAWRHAGRYDERRGTAMAWLATIVRNRALDQLRRLGRERPLEPAMAERWQDPAPGPAELAALSEDGRRLARCLDELEESPRRSILLAYFEGMTVEEVAERMAAPLGTVKSWVRRSLQRLRNCLER